MRKFDLVCFDFDGLLVDTERVHYDSYLKTLLSMGVDLSHVDFLSYCFLAHHKKGSDLFSAILQKAPDFPYSWEEVRKAKRAVYTEEILSGNISLMPGVEEILSLLKTYNIASCVVTNSLSNDTDIIRSFLPTLNEIPLWITKDLYAKGKPHPDGYLKALEYFPSLSLSHVVGLDDTLKGVEAMKQAGIAPILICSQEHPQLAEKGDTIHFPSLFPFIQMTQENWVLYT
jgi:putative hydrolase of the HAD superfamily